MTTAEQKRHLAILGSTGSIGTQALDVIGQHPELFEVELLTANTNSSLLIEQAIKFKPNAVVICDESKYEEVSQALDPHYIKVFTGIDSICDLVKGSNIDMVLTAMVGFSGLKPTVSAIKAGKIIALANKETLVAAGKIIISLAKQYGASIIPVDSEHSAIFQCLQGEHAKIEKLLLTGSGGPFLHSTKEELAKATKAEALNHPRWKMGAKVTIDSASLMNKGLEIIEAKWLFNIDPKEIEVVIHPQSIIHSMVQFSDGSVIAQLSHPDMRIPIQFALSYPYRVDLDSVRLNFAQLGQMTFFSPDLDKFPCLRLAYKALEMGGNAPCIMNAANEVAVHAFLSEKIRFMEIPEVIFNTLEKASFVLNPDIDAIYSTDFEAKQIALKLIKTK
ncbi:MAG: 1-deoxy-D-xylulose-5-phosphate reductoisomerase [Bacteroidales bacterium]|nr:1-deoxy-D-xylulose-5-phosphate reductoisomerase [Bacteroidales bacterium]MDD3200771.1 1-deoxy-D-xylulose-5-phosphate reductoisomerase [Bacteroidales bacterium]